MLTLYELSSPTEHKYGGHLTEQEEARCERRNVLSDEWLPYTSRPCQIENLCGKFANFLDGTEPTNGRNRSFFNPILSSVSSYSSAPFGAQTEFYHLRGQITARNAPGLDKSICFRGVKGQSCLHEIVLDLMLPPTTKPLVHLAIISSFMGVRLQTSHQCYLENKIKNVPWLRLGTRLMDQFNVVRLSVSDWSFGASSVGRKLAEEIQAGEMMAEQIDSEQITAKNTGPNLSAEFEIFDSGYCTENAANILMDLADDSAYFQEELIQNPIQIPIQNQIPTEIQIQIPTEIQIQIPTEIQIQNPTEIQIQAFPKSLWPIENDIVITGKGSVMHRLSWSLDTRVEWTEETEAQVIQICQFVSNQIARMC